MTSESLPANSPPLGDIFSTIPKYASIFASFIILLSITHEYAYFTVIGMEFITVYSAIDFLKLSIFWVPSVVLVSIFGVTLRYYDESKRQRAFAIDSAQAERLYKYPDLSLKIMRRSLFIICIIGLGSASIRNMAVLQMMCLLLLISAMDRLIIKRKLPITNRPLETYLFYLTAVILLTAAFFGGIRDAIRDIDKTEPKFEILTSSPDSGKSIIVLRAIDKGVLYKDPADKRIAFVPWDDVKKLLSPEIIITEKTIYDKFKDAAGL